MELLFTKWLLFSFIYYILGVSFFHWFKENKSEIIKCSMIKEVRTSAGLGSPPMRFTTNRVEAMNSILKLDVDGKKNDVTDVAISIQKIVERQQENVLWAIIGIMIKLKE